MSKVRIIAKGEYFSCDIVLNENKVVPFLKKIKQINRPITKRQRKIISGYDTLGNQVVRYKPYLEIPHNLNSRIEVSIQKII